MERLIHPNIVYYFDSFEDANDFYIIVEYMDNRDLQQLLTMNDLMSQ